LSKTELKDEMQAFKPSDEVDFSRRYTLEEFWALPEREDGAHYDLIEGYIYMVPPANPPHDSLDARFNRALLKFLIDNNIDGEVLHPHAPIYRGRAAGSTYLEPDMMYVSSELREAMGSRRISADIVFEYLSKSTARYDRTKKADAYLALEVRELWFVDPVTVTIEVRHASIHEGSPVWETYKYSTGEYAKSRVLAGWEVSVDEVFKGLI
jgi:Uma2 family endonuclease